MASASPFYLGDARGPLGPTSGSSAPPSRPQHTAASSVPRPYAYDEDDEDHDGYDVGGGAGGSSSSAAAASLQSYQSGSHRPAALGSQYQPPPSRYLGPQPGGLAGGGGGPGGSIRLPPGPSSSSLSSGNPVLFDSGSGSGTPSPLLSGPPPPLLPPGSRSGATAGFGESVLHGPGAAGGGGGGAGLAGPRFRAHTMGDAHASYSTSFSWSLSSACAVAYAFPPLTSVAVLILETTNDLARFHAYQAGLLGVGAWLLLWVLRSVLGWYSLSVIVGMGLLGWFWVCASNAANAAPTLARVPYLPHVGPLAEQWVGEE